MAFKMKGDPMGRNFGGGAPTKKSAYKKDDPEKKASTSETANLLNDLTNYEETVKLKNERDTKPTTYRESDLKHGKGGYDSGALNPANKPQREALMAEQKAKNAKNAAESTESFVAGKAKRDASSARVAKKTASKKARVQSSKDEVARRNALGSKGRGKEDKAAKRAARKA